MRKSPVRLWWPMAVLVCASLGVGVGGGLLRRALLTPSRVAATSVLSTLPIVQQNSLLHTAYGGKAAVMADLFTEYGLRARSDGAEPAAEEPADAFHGIAGNAHAVVACGIQGRRPSCLVRDGQGTWHEDTPGSLASTAFDRLAPSRWRLVADSSYVYFLHHSVYRFSTETMRWHDQASWENPSPGGEVLTLGSSGDGIALCDRPWKAPPETWRFFRRTSAGWQNWPGSTARSHPIPVQCGVGDGFAYVVASSQGDKFPPQSHENLWAPQTILVHALSGSGWDEVYRDDYNIIKDVVPLGDRLVALLQYSAGPMNALEVVNVKRLEWTTSEIRHPDLERLTALSSVASGLAVAGVMRTGGEALGSSAEDQAAVSLWQPNGTWTNEPVANMSRIDRLAVVGDALYAAGSNRGGLLVAARAANRVWTTVVASPVAWYDKLQSEVEVSATPRVAPIAATAVAVSSLGYTIALLWLNRSRFRRPVRIFVSYRRKDTPALAGRVYDHLVHRWGSENVFKDVDTIQPGDAFPAVVAEAIRASHIVVALIGPAWTGISAENPEGRLSDPADWVRRELETALEAGVRIIPVFAAGGTFPSEIPESLSRLKDLHAIPVREDPDFRADVQRLEEALEQAAMQSSRSKARKQSRV